MYTVYTATMANAHWPFGASGQWALTIVAYTSDTRWVKAFQSYTAKQRYTALYSIQLYIAIHYTPSTTPLCLSSVGSLLSTSPTGTPGVNLPVHALQLLQHAGGMTLLYGRYQRYSACTSLGGWRP